MKLINSILSLFISYEERSTESAKLNLTISVYSIQTTQIHFIAYQNNMHVLDQSMRLSLQFDSIISYMLILVELLLTV